MKSSLKYLLLSLALLAGCTDTETKVGTETEKEVQSTQKTEEVVTSDKKAEDEKVNSVSKNDTAKVEQKEEPKTQPKEEPKPQQTSDLGKPDTSKHKLIKVDGGDTSGHRQANVVVDIGFGDREYWAYTNQHGQLVRVTAKEVILQNDKTEPVKNGRYYAKMADVPGVGEKYGYDRGHVLADSLGGVANAYNITPQEATLNRHGDQAYMEDSIRKAGGASNFEAIITYPDTETQIPSKYKITYTIKGNTVTDEFANGNPDKANEAAGLTKPTQKAPPATSTSGSVATQGDLSSVDINGNGKVTVKEAKDAGIQMPVTKDHWLYQYMDDRDGDGSVGE